jgi:photosystem II stability/assembly factor-like uncharacterized protein
MKALFGAVMVAVICLSGCGVISGKGSPAAPPTDVAVVPGDTSITVTWTMQPDVEYWLFFGPTAFISTSNYDNPSIGGHVIRGATSPTVVPNLVNGVTYSVTINGRTDGGPGGNGSPSISAIPRPAGAGWIAEQPIASGTVDLHSVIFTGIVVTAGSGGALFSSSDELNWSPLNNPAVPANSNLNALVNGGALIIAAGANGVILTTTDASIWTQVAMGITSNELTALATNGAGAYVAVGRSGTVMFSANGQNWSAPIPTPAGSTDLRSVIFGNGKWIAVGDSGMLLTSSDGNTWSLGNSNTSQNLKGMTHSPTEFVAVGDAGSVITSVDGSTWTAIPAITGTNLNSVTVGELFVAVGDGGVIFTSPDGTNWQSRASGTTSNIYSVTIRGSSYSAVGAAGANLVAI